MKIALFLCFSFMIWSCQKDDALNSLNVIKADGSENGEDEVYDGLTVLGAQEANPYSSQNMRYAYNALVTAGELQPNAIQLGTTHLYIRALPNNKEDLDAILNCNDLDLFDYPLDYEIVAQGTYYHDPSVPDSEYTYIYTVIPIGYQFPTAFEVLDSCIIPLDIHNPNYDILSQIEKKSCELFQEDEDELSGNQSGQQRCESHNPSGTISVYNTDINDIEGIRDIKVTMRNVVKVSSRYTDDNGYYASETNFWRKKIHYALHFKNANGVQIRSNVACLIPAYYNKGKCNSNGITFALYRNSVAWKWATTNNAEKFYYTTICSDFNITLPASDLRIWVTPLLSIFSSSSGSAPMLHRIKIESALSDTIENSCQTRNTANNLLPDIIILRTAQDSTHDFQSTVWHELAHASHYEQAHAEYWNNFVNGIIWNQLLLGNCYGNGTHPRDGYIAVGEMWAYFMEYKTIKQFLPASSYYKNNYEIADYWFKPAIMKKLNTNMLFVYNIFACLTPDVHTIPALKNKLQQTYPLYYLSIEQIFNEYGF